MAVGGIFILFALFALAALGFVIWALVDALKVPEDSMYRSGSKLVWILVILLGGFIGAIIYAVVGRPTNEGSALGPGTTPGAYLPPPPPPPGG